MGEYQKAKDLFLVVRDLYDENREENLERIIDCCKDTSICLALDNKYDEAIKFLSALLSENSYEQHKSKILASLASIAKISEDVEKFFVYAEGSLNLDPTNTDLRFDLAYRYSKKGHNKLSLLHYKKLTNTLKSAMGLNNLGVQYDNLKLPSKSIKSYLKAASYDNTLSMANLAQRYLNEGFTDDANLWINNANKLATEGIEVHGNVGYAKNRLDQISEEEETKEKEILIEAEKEKDFRVKYSEAYYSGIKIDKGRFEGEWKTPLGDLEIAFNETTNSFEIKHSKKVKVEGLETLLKEKLEPGKEHFKTRLITINGNSVNLSARYIVEMEDIVEYEYLTPERKKVYKASGYMVINQNYRVIDVMEKTEDDKCNMATWERK